VPLVRGFGPSILINGVAPYFIYFVLHHQFQVAELPALVATSIPPLLDALVGHCALATHRFPGRLRPDYDRPGGWAGRTRG
jgi:hypothetical protein